MAFHYFLFIYKKIRSTISDTSPFFPKNTLKFYSIPNLFLHIINQFIPIAI